MMNGIDISSWQGDIDLSAITDLDFVIVKATEGCEYTNPYCDSKIQQAKSIGICYGFYHFASGTDPICEADYFVNECLGYFSEGIPVLDFEANAVDSWKVDGARMFLQRVYERTGVRPLIYMSQSVTTRFDWTQVASEYGLWVAKYPNVVNPDFTFDMNFDASIGAWEFMAIWQYASDGRVNGYGGDLDLNHAFMNREAWAKYANANLNISGESDKSLDVLENENYKITIESKK